MQPQPPSSEATSPGLCPPRAAQPPTPRGKVFATRFLAAFRAWSPGRGQWPWELSPMSRRLSMSSSWGHAQGSVAVRRSRGAGRGDLAGDRTGEAHVIVWSDVCGTRDFGLRGCRAVGEGWPDQGDENGVKGQRERIGGGREQEPNSVPGRRPHQELRGTGEGRACLRCWSGKSQVSTRWGPGLGPSGHMGPSEQVDGGSAPGLGREPLLPAPPGRLGRRPAPLFFLVPGNRFSTAASRPQTAVCASVRGATWDSGGRPGERGVLGSGCRAGENTIILH